MATSTPRSVLAVAAIVAGVALLVPVVVADPVLFRGYNLPRYGVVVLGATLALGALADLLLSGRFPPIGRAFPLLVGLEIGALTISSVVAAPDLRLAVVGSFERQMGLIAYAAFAVLALAARVAVARSPERFAWLLRAVYAAGLLAFLMGPYVRETDIRRWTGAFGHANYSANFLLLPGFVALGFAAGRFRPIERAFAAAAFILVAIEIAMLQTRGAWLGAAVGAAVFLPLLLFGPVRLEGAVRRRLGLVLAAAALVAAVGAGAVLATPRLREPALAKARSTLRLQAGTSGRYEGWRDSVPFFRDHGLLGVGAENFRDSFLEYKSLELGRVLQEQQLRDLHSMPLHIWAQGGVLGLIAHLGLFACALARLARTIRARSLALGPRTAAAGLLAALVAHFVHNLTICHVIASGFLFHVCVGIAAGAGDAWPPADDAPDAAATSKGERRRREQQRRELALFPERRAAPRPVRIAVAIAAAALVIAATVDGVRRLRADAAIVRALNAGARGDVGGLLREGNEAVRLAPDVGHYHHLISAQLVSLAAAGIRPPGDRSHATALAHARAAHRLGGNAESYPLHLAGVHWLRGERELAERHVRESVSIDGHFWNSRRLLAEVLLARGAVGEARAEARMAEALSPGRPEVQQLIQTIDRVPAGR